MLRLIGILTGAALAIAFLIVALGVPEFARPEAGINPEPLLDMTAQPQPAAEPEPEVTMEAAPKPEAEPVAELVSEPDYEALVEQIFAPEPDSEAEPESAPVIDENWYAFWSPFRSELAANGFVSKLQEATGIDYRVVKIKTGVYEVAFAYSDDEDIEEKLARISAATGLDMSDS
jgi:hypothetical protein